MAGQVFVVIEASSAAAVGQACAELLAAGQDGGLVLSRSFDEPRSGLVCAGEVGGTHDAERAVLAALAGAHLVIAASAPRHVIDVLCEDLRRLGTLDHRIGSGPDGPDLGATERALLERLLAGESLGQAAAALHLSRRTADRRLAAARQALGAATTAEALGIYLSVR